MRKIIPPRLEAARRTDMPYKGLTGAYEILGPTGAWLRIIGTTAEIDMQTTQGWEHVSVSTANRCPNWPEMCFVKDLFWDPFETVMQLHPPQSEWISNHPYCLHLWRHILTPIPMPPGLLVGSQQIGDMSKMTPAERAEVLRKAARGDYG